MALKSFKLDGPGGTATCKLKVLVDQTDGQEKFMEVLLQGCIVSSKDENLKKLLDSWKDLTDNQNIFLNHKYFFYSPFNEMIRKQVEAITIYYPKDGSPNHHEEGYVLKRKLKHVVVVNKSHLFILCESEELNKNFPFIGKNYLEKHSKQLGLNRSLKEEMTIYGLGKIDKEDEEGKLNCFLKLDIKRREDETSSNEYMVLNTENFEKLFDTGPILVDEHTLVGSFVKVGGPDHELGCRISCSVFEVQVKKTTDTPPNGLEGRTQSHIPPNTEGRQMMSSKNREKEGTEHSDSEMDGEDGNKSKVVSDKTMPKFSLEETLPSTDDMSDHENKNKKKNSDFDSTHSSLPQLQEAFKNLKMERHINQLRTEKMKDENLKLKEEKIELQKKLNEKSEEENTQLKQENKTLKEDNKELQKKLDKKSEEESRQLKQENKTLREDKIELQKKLDKKSEEENTQLKMTVFILFTIILIIIKLTEVNNLQMLFLGLLIFSYLLMVKLNELIK